MEKEDTPSSTCSILWPRFPATQTCLPGPHLSSEPSTYASSCLSSLPGCHTGSSSFKCPEKLTLPQTCSPGTTLPPLLNKWAKYPLHGLSPAFVLHCQVLAMPPTSRGPTRHHPTPPHLAAHPSSPQCPPQLSSQHPQQAVHCSPGQLLTHTLPYLNPAQWLLVLFRFPTTWMAQTRGSCLPLQPIAGHSHLVFSSRTQQA